MRATFADASGGEGAAVFTAARERALEARRFRRRRNGAEREALDFTQVDGDRVPNPSVVFDHELVELVWDAAAALPPEEYSLVVLDLGLLLALGLSLPPRGVVKVWAPLNDLYQTR